MHCDRRRGRESRGTFWTRSELQTKVHARTYVTGWVEVGRFTSVFGVAFSGRPGATWTRDDVPSKPVGVNLLGELLRNVGLGEQCTSLGSGHMCLRF